MKTREEVEQLKREWLDDPCWDIEDTAGFEDYWQELHWFGKYHAEIRGRKYAESVAELASFYGVTSMLVEKLKNMESRIAYLENKIWE